MSEFAHRGGSTEWGDVESGGPVVMHDLNRDAQMLLLTLDRLTPPKRTQKREARLAETVAEEAGLAQVGRPDTRLARAMHAFRGLIELGYVERAKEEEADGPIKYRITQLGERELRVYEHGKLTRLAEKTIGELNVRLDAEGDLRRHVQRELRTLEDEHEDLLRKWERRGIRRLWRR